MNRSVAVVVGTLVFAGCGEVTSGGDEPDAGAQTVLEVMVLGDGIGTVTSDPPGISCPGQCSAEFEPGTTVTLAESTDVDSSLFGGWGGDCTANNGNCVVALDGSRTATATFDCTGMRQFDFTGSIETFAVPACASSITIEAFGAQGGRHMNSPGGLGARIKGTFELTTDTLSVLVGELGQSHLNPSVNFDDNGGGGGASYVYASAEDPAPLIVAGGGGGAASQCTAGPGSDTEAPTDSINGAGDVASALGGTDGNGGAGGERDGTSANIATGGGGAGWLTNGADGTLDSKGGGGVAPRNGGDPGAAGPTGARGGFGGGGGSAGNAGAGGGGGGYNGGGGGDSFTGTNWGCGGGGGSFNAGTNPEAERGVQAGNGQVTITW